ncbi:MAG: GNAT family N-acetyltransferase [Bacilli bacterium]
MEICAYTNRIPEVHEYVLLREAAGLTTKHILRSRKGLQNSLFIVTLYHNERLVGMGRVIGDGGCFFHVVDIAVHPNIQGKGYGQQIMRTISSFLDATTLPTDYVTLIADVPADELYRKFGFENTAPESIGMIRRATM